MKFFTLLATATALRASPSKSDDSEEGAAIWQVPAMEVLRPKRAPHQVILRHEKTEPVAKNAAPVAAVPVAKVPPQQPSSSAVPGASHVAPTVGAPVLPQPAVVYVPHPPPALHALGSKVLTAQDPPPAKEEKKEEKKEEVDEPSLQDKVDAMREEMCRKDPSKDGCEEFRTQEPKKEPATAPAPETQAPAEPAPAPLPSQGFEGPPVTHENGETATQDWRKEYGKDGPQYRASSAASISVILLALLI